MSVNQFTQILEEEYIIGLFRLEYPGFPKGKLVKTESPDFILKENSKNRIGIELTKLHGPVDKKEKTHFPAAYGYQPPELNKENIEYTISAKDEKLPLYQRKKLTQIWLLITANLDESPVTFNLNNKLEKWNFFSGFQKIFLFELKARKVYELNLTISC